jgi:hypothetical protein
VTKRLARQKAAPAFALLDISTQEQALVQLAKLTAEDTFDPIVRRAAIKIVRKCKARDDVCELSALFEAVKHGDKQIPGLENGVKYMSDNFWVDGFVSPAQMLRDCEAGACAEDCDSQGALMAALAGSLGFRVGVRAWGPSGESGFAHIYAVAIVPKDEPDLSKCYEFGLDTSADVGDSHAGWQPDEGNVATAWITGDDFEKSPEWSRGQAPAAASGRDPYEDDEDDEAEA